MFGVLGYGMEFQFCGSYTFLVAKPASETDPAIFSYRRRIRVIQNSSDVLFVFYAFRSLFQLNLSLRFDFYDFLFLVAGFNLDNLYFWSGFSYNIKTVVLVGT